MVESRRGNLSHEVGVGELVLVGQELGEEGSSDLSKSQKAAVKSGVGKLCVASYIGEWTPAI